MNKNKKMPKKPRRKTKKPKKYKDKSVKQNVNVKNIINAGGGAGGGGSSSYPVPMPQYIQSPIPQAFQQANTENMNMRSLLDEVKHAIKRTANYTPTIPNNSDSVNAGFRDVRDQFDPIIKDIEPKQELFHDIDNAMAQLPFGSNTKEQSGNLSEFLQDIEQNPEYLEEAPEEDVQEVASGNNPILNPKSEDPNKSLLSQVYEQTGMVQEKEPEQDKKEEDEEPKPVKQKKARAKKEYSEPYIVEEGGKTRMLVYSNLTGKTLDITKWPMWSENSFIRIDPNNPEYHINTKSGIYGNGRKNKEKYKQQKEAVKTSAENVKVNFVQPEAEGIEQVMTSKRASR